jgi:hypothetical protein
MTFLTLDDKEECVGFYHSGKLVFGEEMPHELYKTWKHHSYLKNKNVKYANILVGGKEYDEVCPEHLKEEWSTLNTKAKAFVRSFIESKVSLKQNCFFDLVPQKFLSDYCEIKCQIIDWVFDNTPEPADYQCRHDLEVLIADIRKQKISFDEEQIKNNLHDTKTKEFHQTYGQKDNHIVYNQFSSKTGRLTTEENSFPILNLSKSLRSYIKADNDFLLDIDYNAAEVRVFLGLNEVKQPTNDIHEWNMDKFGYGSRTLAKNDFISWLYGKKNDREAEFRKYYNADKIKKKYWDGNKIINHYGRLIKADEFHVTNYVVQSTTADMALRQVLKVNEILKGYQSKIKMIIHDNIVIDMKKEEKHLIKNIVDTYNNTDFGKFRSSVKIGKNLGNMRNIL